MSTELVESLNRLFAGIQDLDMKVRHTHFTKGVEMPTAAYDGIDDLLKAWLSMARQLNTKPDDAGCEDLLLNIRAAEWALASDEELLNNEHFIAFRDKAIEDYKSGRVEPMTDGFGG